MLMTVMMMLYLVSNQNRTSNMKTKSIEYALGSLTALALVTAVSFLVLKQGTERKPSRKQGRVGKDQLKDEEATRDKSVNNTPAVSDASSPPSTVEGDDSVEDWSEQLPSHMRREQMKLLRRQQKLPMLAMKSQMYDNITMIDPEGNILSKISRKKGRWYVSKNLGMWVNNDKTSSSSDKEADENTSTCIQLTFKPKAKPTYNNEYGQSVKKNMCVACGGTENQMRFYIVPYAYRTLFPKKYKSKLSHDITVLCADCHLICGQQVQYRMNDMEEKFNIPKRFTTDFDLYRVRSSSLALMNSRAKIPAEKISYHESIVRAHLAEIGDRVEEDKEISKEQLQTAIDVDYKIENPNYIPGPTLVVDSISSDDKKMEDFIRGWRQFFLDTIHPRHLPRGWRVDYPVHID